MNIYHAQKTQVFALSNTTGSYSLFTYTGVVGIYQLYGIVTTVISSNHTAGGFRIVAGAGATNITTLGLTISSVAVGSYLTKTSGVGSALSARSPAATGNVVGGNTQGDIMTYCMLGLNTGQTSGTLEYRHTTTNTPESGAVEFHVFWSPLIPGSTLVAA